jgi:hypothetical protein
LWKFFGWSGVCLGGMSLATLSIIIYLFSRKKGINI